MIGAGVSISLSRDGVHGESICSSIFSLISDPFPREHGFYVGSVPFSREQVYYGKCILPVFQAVNGNVSSVSCLYVTHVGSAPYSKEHGLTGEIYLWEERDLSKADASPVLQRITRCWESLAMAHKLLISGRPDPGWFRVRVTNQASWSPDLVKSVLMRVEYRASITNISTLCQVFSLSSGSGVGLPSSILGSFDPDQDVAKPFAASITDTHTESTLTEGNTGQVMAWTETHVGDEDVVDLMKAMATAASSEDEVLSAPTAGIYGLFTAASDSPDPGAGMEDVKADWWVGHHVGDKPAPGTFSSDGVAPEYQIRTVLVSRTFDLSCPWSESLLSNGWGFTVADGNNRQRRLIGKLWVVACPDLQREACYWYEGSPDLFIIDSRVRVVGFVGAGCIAQAYGGVMAVIWNPFLMKSVLVGTGHCSVAVTTFSNADFEPVDVAVAENANIRCGYEGWFGRPDGRLPKIPVAVSTTEFGPLWSTDFLDLVWMPSFRSSVANFAYCRRIHARLRSRLARFWVHFHSRWKEDMGLIFGTQR